MPVKIPSTLPAREILEGENIFVMSEERAKHQDIRPLRVAIPNLMPTKVQTETQILRLLGNSALQVDVTLLHTATHEHKNVSADHLLEHYYTFSQVKHRKFDGLIITGAPVEQLPFEEVDYWPELTEIMDWADENVFATFFICWGAQAGLYYHYGIPKYPIGKKLFGVFEHRVIDPKMLLFRGFDDVFVTPHSRYTENRLEDIENCNFLKLAAWSEKAGVHVVVSKDNRQIFVTGHFEYNANTLKAEYDRDVAKGLDIAVPENYYPNNDPSEKPMVKWRANANLFFINWLNYCVYQETPFEW